jgi:hypothetical protein
MKMKFERLDWIVKLSGLAATRVFFILKITSRVVIYEKRAVFDPCSGYLRCAAGRRA